MKSLPNFIPKLFFFFYIITKWIDRGNAKNVPKMPKRHQKCIDFFKALDKLCHDLLVDKLEKLDN